MESEDKKWLLTHDSHTLKKGEVYEGKELPAWLVGKAVPLAVDHRSAHDLEGEKALRNEIESLTETGREAQTRLKAAEAELEKKDGEIKTLTTEIEELQKANAELQSQVKALKKG
jgi:septal ring factor EnvC (AmiA/AmiB activator)